MRGRVTRDADGADVGVGGAGQPDAAHRGGGEHEPARATDDGQGHQRQRGALDQGRQRAVGQRQAADIPPPHQSVGADGRVTPSG